MAAPTLTARGTPVGTMMRDGYRSLIALANDDDILFWEKQVTPPGLDGGDPINTTTMHNDQWRTFSSMALITLTPFSTVAAWDPRLYLNILAILNDETSISVHFPAGDAYWFYGYLQRLEPGPLVEGTQPEATVTFVPTNFDPVNFVEADPQYGTG